MKTVFSFVLNLFISLGAKACYEPIYYNVMTDGETRATLCSVSDGNVEMSAGVTVGNLWKGKAAG